MDFFAELSADTAVTVPAGEEPDFHPPRNLPLLPTIAAAQTDESRIFWEQAHQFFQTKGSLYFEKDESAVYEQPPVSVGSALLAPYENMRGVSYDYPLWIAEKSDNIPDGLFMPVAELLRGALKAFAPENNQAKTLRDNIPRIEMYLRDAMSASGQPEKFELILAATLEKTRAQLDLTGEESKAFEADLKKLSSHLPVSGTVVGFSGDSVFYVLATLLKANHSSAQLSFNEEITQLTSSLKNLLLVEKSNLPEERKPERLKQSLGFSSEMINPNTLSEILPESASVAMSPERKQRIQRTLDIISDPENQFWTKDALLLIHESCYQRPGFSWETCFTNSSVSSYKDGSGAESAAEIFKKQMEIAARIFAAIRIAKMEIDDLYRTEIHDLFFQNFNWKRMGNEELSLVPPVILFEDESSLKDNPQLLSKLLLSAKPINVIVLKNSLLQNETEKFSSLNPEDDQAFGFRQELGLLAVSHRKAFVSQASVSHLEHLIQSLSTGIKTGLPSFFNVLAPTTTADQADQTFLVAGAAVESREFPLFSYDPNRGLEWGSRFLVSANPQPEQEWPIYELDVCSEDGTESSLSLAFTPADFMVLSADAKNYYLDVPAQFWSEDSLLPLAEYLRLPLKDTHDKLPFLWTIDEQRVLHRILPNIMLTEICRERLDAWSFVQDFGGSNNYHAKLAAEQARAEAELETEKKIAELEVKHQAELEQVRQQTAGEAMERLTAVLMDLDPLSVLPSGKAAKTASPAEITPLKSAEQNLEALVEDTEEESEVADEEISEEAWLETFRCTTCNECTEMSPTMFDYNEDKQAFIKDINAGTYQELVLAAEECPAKCIHPGQPFNPDEAGLEDLIKRAAVFN